MRFAAVGFALGIAACVAWLSKAPTTYARPDDALLRLSWRVLGLRVEECRRRSEEELEALAPHMRTPEVCSGRTADYELRVELDGADASRDTIRAGGARGDRPVYVYRDIPVRPGRHSVRVAFNALVSGELEADRGPVGFAFEEDIDVAPTEVALITLDSAGSELVRLRR